MSNTTNILWTGGWDSTFRMIQLARAGKSIQPYYLIDTDRLSSLVEMTRMSEIKADLIAKYNCIIHDVILININEMNFEQKYKDAHARLTKKSFMGKQYIWLAQLASKYNDLELSVHKDDKAAYFVELLDTNDNSDENLLFGNLKFPLLNYTKLEMEQECIEYNDMDILNKSWFCYTPIDETPCGLCNPCKYSIQEGMSRRFNLRGRIYAKFPLPFKVLRRLSRKFI